MRRIASATLVVGALLVIASLYLPWKTSAADPDGLEELLVSFFRETSGWSVVAGWFAALVGLGLLALAAITMFHSGREDLLPLVRTGLSLGYLAGAVAVTAELLVPLRKLQLRGVLGLDRAVSFSWGAGAYVALAGVVLLASTLMVLRWRELSLYRRPSDLVVPVIAAGLLVSCLLPWMSYRGPEDSISLQSPGVATPQALLAGITAIWASGCPIGVRASDVNRLLLAVATAVLTTAAFAAIPFPATRSYGAWLGLGLALALVAATAAPARLALRRSISNIRDPLLAAASVAVVVGLFLPWQRACYGSNLDEPLLAGRCLSNPGWSEAVLGGIGLPDGSMIGIIAITLAATALGCGHLQIPRPLLALLLAVFVTTAGLRLESHVVQDTRYEVGEGAVMSLVAAGVAVVLSFESVRRLRRPPSGWLRAATAATAILLAVALATLIVLTWWDLLPIDIERYTYFWAPSWLSAVGFTLTAALSALWVVRLRGAGIPRPLVMGAPVVILALEALEAAATYIGPTDAVWGTPWLNWGAATGAALTLLLVVLGWLDHVGHRTTMRVPAALRLDRI